MLLDKMRGSIERHDLLPRDEMVVVAVSGGPDSLCLLHALRRLEQEYGLTLHIAHLHHGLRGADADSDADFVQTLAANWGLACTVEWADVPTLVCEHRLTIEEAARRARYSFLQKTARAVGAQTVAVGHNADDQSETVLMHWLRGAGLAGLRGMSHLSSLGDYRLFDDSDPHGRQTGLRLIRPLLDVTRDQIEAYCDFHELEPRFDQSNLDTTYFRNWLREEVIPLLAGHNPNVREVIRRSAKVISDDYALLRTILEETWPRVVVEQEAERVVFDLEEWRRLPTSLKRSTVREAIRCLRRSLRNINFAHVENAMVVACKGVAGKQATLPQGLVLCVGYDRLTISDSGSAAPSPNWPLLSPAGEPLVVSIPGTTQLPEGGGVLVAKLLARGELPAGWDLREDPWRAFVDFQVVGSSLWLRARKPGDRFQPLGMDGHSAKVADLLTNQKVPRNARDLLPLLVGPSGIVWVCGQRLDERARVQDHTNEVLALRFASDLERLEA